MNTIQKIREIMGLPKTNLYAEVKIDDGRVLVTEADAFEPGVDVRVIDDSGSTVVLEQFPKPKKKDTVMVSMTRRKTIEKS